MLYTNFGFAGAAQRNLKLVNITVFTSTLDIRVKCASASFLDDEGHVKCASASFLDDERRVKCASASFLDAERNVTLLSKTACAVL